MTTVSSFLFFPFYINLFVIATLSAAQKLYYVTSKHFYESVNFHIQYFRYFTLSLCYFQMIEHLYLSYYDRIHVKHYLNAFHLF